MMSANMLQQFAMKMINDHPEVIQNNPRGQELASIIQNGDVAKGIQTANNICNGYGTSQTDALAMAGKFFGIR